LPTDDVRLDVRAPSRSATSAGMIRGLAGPFVMNQLSPALEKVKRLGAALSGGNGSGDAESRAAEARPKAVRKARDRP